MGPLIIRDPAKPRPDVEFFIFMHALQPVGHRPAAAVRLHERPRLRGQHADARVEGGRPGRLPRDRARQRLPHLPHPRPPLGGPDGTVIDTKTLGPGDSFTARVHRGQPGPLVLPLPRVQPPTHGDERVVPRQLSTAAPPRRRRRSRCSSPRCVLGGASAGAANRRVAIGHYQWSIPQIHLDLGEHVTWYWVGPDTLHSVTGTSPNDAGLGLGSRVEHAPARPRRHLPAHLQPARHLHLPVQAPLRASAAR